MKKIVISLILFISIVEISSAQLVRIEPANAGIDDEIRLIFDAKEGDGELIGSEKVYFHSGVILEPRGLTWTNVVGNYGDDDGVGEMTPVEGEEDLWEITLGPTARDYYGIASDISIYRLSMVFRNADGSQKGTIEPGSYSWGFVADNRDIYVDLAVENTVFLTSPTDSEILIQPGETISLGATASSSVTSMELFLDEGSGFNSVASVTTGTEINFDYTPQSSGQITVVVDAELNGVQANDTLEVNIAVLQTTEVAELPAGLKRGINYDTNDDTRVTLVLEAPNKDFVYVLGDFNNWEFNDDYQMKQDGDLFWLEISNLTAGQEYIFQYWVNDSPNSVVKVGDPYADKVVDPWNDSFIEDSVYPDLIAYDKTQYGIATVLQTAQAPYQWASSENDWVRPDEQDLIVYELLVRDFVGSHSYADVIDSLDYLKRMGVNAIELMPIMEFEGNSSWGYNPSYFFAVDKYYGTKNDLKKFIEICHQEGFAVILDMVLNHAFGQNAMVRMYWDDSQNKPAANSPWFNPDAKHPFNVGFDFNHTTRYTESFVDTVNQYWLEEYHFDGYRFDLSKGFTQKFTTDVGEWSAYDFTRVSILKRMYNQIRKYDSTAYVILEHFGDNQEETELGELGMLMWRNSHFDFKDALQGNNRNISSANSTIHVSYMESHDEQRVMYEMEQGGLSEGSYDVKIDAAALERSKMGAAFLFFQPGPKMLWQFGELGYDLDINFNGRTGEKPLPWGANGLGYYEDELRGYVYDAYSAIINLRKDYNHVVRQEFYESNLTGDLKSITIDHHEIDIVVIGNFGTSEGEIQTPITKTGNWYDYFSGEEISVSATPFMVDLAPGEFKIFTDSRVSDGFENVVEPFKNPVVFDPPVFNLDTEVTITVDVANTSNNGTNELAGESEIYMIAGLVSESNDSEEFAFEVGDLSDNSVGEMTNVDGDTWEITFTPRDYFDVPAGTDIYRIGVYFRNTDGSKLGYGFRDKIVFNAVNPEGNIIATDPERFYSTESIKIIFDASFGNGELMGADKVYLHSGVVLSDKEEPTGSDWSNVVGNWGQDDGVGEMTRIGDSEKWELEIVPRDYYGLSSSDSIFWISMVPRNSNGSVKATIQAGTIGKVFSSTSGDLFYKVLSPENDDDVLSIGNESERLVIYPNPASDFLYLEGLSQSEISTVQVFEINGRVVYSRSVKESVMIDISTFKPGLYFVKILSNDLNKTFKLIVE
jgi:glycosidase